MPYYIGLDVGGTKIAGVLVDRKLRVVKRAEIPTEAGRGRGAVISNIVSVVRSLGVKNVSGIGVGAPGFADSRGRLQMTPNIAAFRNLRLQAELERRLKRRIRLDNDAHCFVLAEQRAGAAKGTQNVIGLTLGTGVGGGAVVSGRLLEGRDGGAAHFGHMVVSASGPRCDCGLKGDLESWCGGKYLERRYSMLSKGRLSAAEIFASRDKTARRVVSDFYGKLSVGVASLIAAFNPEVVVFGGSISNNLDIGRLKGEVGNYAPGPLLGGVRFLRNRLGPSAGVFGAACLAMGR